MPAEAAVKKALEGAEQAVLTAVRRGDYEAAARLIMTTMREAFSLMLRSLGELREVVSEQGKQIGQLADGLEALREQVSKLTEGLNILRTRIGELSEEITILAREARERISELSENVSRLTNAIREEAKLREALEKGLESLRADVRGFRSEWYAARRMIAWFSRNAPEYDIIEWFKTGADVLVEGRGVFAAVEITTRPHYDDIEQLKVGVGAVKNAWGRKPDLLVVWSESGVVPEDVARYAAERGVRIVRGPRELRELLDRLAEEREGRAGRPSEG